MRIFRGLLVALPPTWRPSRIDISLRVQHPAPRPSDPDPSHFCGRYHFRSSERGLLAPLALLDKFAMIVDRSRAKFPKCRLLFPLFFFRYPTWRLNVRDRAMETRFTSVSSSLTVISASIPSAVSSFARIDANLYSWLKSQNAGPTTI